MKYSKEADINNMTVEECKKEINDLISEKEKIDNMIANLRQCITIIEMMKAI